MVLGDLDEVEVGQRLCVTGRGTANPVHRHVTVTSITKLFVNSEWTTKRGTFKDRHRKDSARSTPYSEYGGTNAHLTCQRPEDRLKPLKLEQEKA